MLTVTSPFSAWGSSHWITMVVELKGRTRTFRGAAPGSVKKIKRCYSVIVFNQININLTCSFFCTVCLIQSWKRLTKNNVIYYWCFHCIIIIIFIWSQKYCLALRKKDNLMWKMTEIFTRFSCGCINWDTLRASANTVHSHHDKLVFGERGQASYVIKCCYGSWDLLVVPRGKTRFVIYDIILKVNSCMVVKINSKGQEKNKLIPFRCSH